MATKTPMTILLYHRLVSYLHYLKALPKDGPANISSAAIANALGFHEVQVRKDLAMVSDGGKPKIGYIIKYLVGDLEHYLGHDNCTDAVLVGVGNLGKALLSYENFKQYGLKIVAAFDRSSALVGTEINGVKVLDVTKLTDLCARLNIRIGIVAVPALAAQGVADALLEGDVRAIWNFAPVNLQVPEHIVVKNEDMAASLAVLTKQLAAAFD